MDRLPQQYIQPQLADMAPGTSGWTVPWAMQVDGQGRGFLNGRYPLYPAPEGTATMRVERLAQGYRVTIPPGERWRPSAYTPGRAGLPVVEVQEAPMGHNNDPLTPQEIHRALALIEAGERPGRAAIRCALLMALALHAAQAVTAQQAARIAELEAQVTQYREMWEAQHAQA